ncbi:MAG: hypothetical protein K2O48_01650, partial [Prevotella sp.]|nr:hypothetical protein [Prevotella sp.]
SSWKDVIREWQERLKWVQGRQMRGKTYISKTEWDNYTKKRTESENEAHKLRRKHRKEDSDNLKNKIYSDYVYKLQSLCYSSTRSWDNAEFDWIRECQHNMKELREKSGCKKSIWETWDGVHEP